MSTGDAAALLNSEARVRIDAATFSALTPVQFEALDAMMFYTRAAVIIQCLRLLERNSANSKKWTNLLRKFEPFAFPNDSPEVMKMVPYVNQLISLTVRLEKLMGDHTLGEQERSRQMRLWWEEWLDPMSDDPAMIQQLGYEFGMPILLQVFGEMHQLADLVSKIGTQLNEDSH